MIPSITLPTRDIRDMFKDIYPREEDAWLFPSYRLGLKTVLIKGTIHMEIPNRDPDAVTAFNSGYLDGIEFLQGRKEVQRSMSVPSTKSSTHKYSSTKEYNPGF